MILAATLAVAAVLGFVVCLIQARVMKVDKDDRGAREMYVIAWLWIAAVLAIGAGFWWALQ